MTTNNILFSLFCAMLIGGVVGSLTEKYIQDEPYFIFPVDTVLIYKDTLYVDTYSIINEHSTSWESCWVYYDTIAFKFEGEPTTADSITITMFYH